MKKVFPILCVATFLSSSFAMYSQASEVNKEVEDITEVDQITTEKETSQFDEVKELSLEEVINRGTENNKNLTVLQLSLAIQKNDQLQANFDINKAARDIKKIEKKIDDLKNEKDRLEGEERSENFKDRAELRDSIEELEKEIESLGHSIKQIENGQIQLQFQEEEAKVGVRLLLTSRYTNLLLLQREIEFTKKTLVSVNKEYAKQETLYKLGRISKEAFRQAERALEDAIRQLDEKEKNYRYALTDLSFDIGVAYNKDMVLKPMEFKLLEVEKPTDYTFLMEESYKMKKAQMNFESAIIDRDRIYEDFKKGDATKYEKENQDYLFQLAEVTLTQTKKDLQISMEQLYRNTETSQLNYEDASRELEIKQKELQLLKVRYNLGRVSKFDYEKAQLELDAVELNVYKAKMQRYNFQQSVEALQNGYI